MTWLVLIFVALAIAVGAALTGIKPSGTKPVANTRMMAAARVVLLLVAAVLLFFAWRSMA